MGVDLISLGDIEGDVKGPMELQREVSRRLQGLAFEEVTLNQRHFLPNTTLPVMRYNYIFKDSGIGDYICYMPAMLWTAQNNPWVSGRIVVAELFHEFALNIMRGHERWSVYPAEKFDEIPDDLSMSRGPGIEIRAELADGKKMTIKNYQLVNGTGGHLVDLGFMYFVNKFRPKAWDDKYPGWDFHPQIDFSIWPGKKDILHNKYVVFTTGATTEARSVPGQYWNPIIDYVKSLGFTPVFLGVRQLVDLKIKYKDGCNYAEGIDMRDKTTLMEAAWVMKNAAAVVGLDNGLIHLASCTDANVVAAYNIVDPSDRRTKRGGGGWAEIYLTESELACTGCQTNMTNMFPHNFNKCLYHKTRCIDMLFSDGASRFIRALRPFLS